MSQQLVSESAIFECQQCGECCNGYGGTYVTETDIAAIADYIGVPREGFVSTYCRISGNKLVLAQGENGYCIFWKKLCGIHPVKPRMCREWPYIKSVLKAPENWRMMASCCPGMRTDIVDETIVAGVSNERENMEKSQKMESGK
ncbi:MAG: YkgJ family cysteine cluster protein [Pseudomonadota bacterium]